MTVQNKTFVCVVESLFQLLGALGLADSLTPDSGIDLIISSRVHNADEVKRIIGKLELFDNIYLTNGYYIECRTQGIDFIIDFFSTKDHGEDYFNRICPDLEKKKYDVLLCSGVTRLTIDIKRFCVRDGESWFFDDGTGSHNGEVFTAFLFFDTGVLSRHRKINKSILRKRIASFLLKPFAKFARCEYRMTSLWLFSPNQIDLTNYSDRIVIRSLSCGVVESFFDRILTKEERNAYANCKCIYLTLPEDISLKARQQEIDLCRFLFSSIGDDFAIRLHPRRTINDFSSMGMNVLNSEPPWEALIMAGDISENTVLMAVGSTAQISPWMLKKEQPYIVMLHKLIDCGARYSALELTAKSYRDSYTMKERVIIPASIDELMKAVVPLCRGCDSAD